MGRDINQSMRFACDHYFIDTGDLKPVIDSVPEPREDPIKNAEFPVRHICYNGITDLERPKSLLHLRFFGLCQLLNLLPDSPAVC